MREILFQGQRFDGTWVNGYFFAKPILETYFIIDGENQWMVHKESVGQYTGMNEFVMTDKFINAPLFEGDIVEVWSRRRSIFKYMHEDAAYLNICTTSLKASMTFR